MAANGLISKLCAARVVERENHDLRFANDFCTYLAQYNRRNLRNRAATVEGWRNIMTSYHNSLRTISDEEIGMTIMLLDYFLEKVAVR
jgi:hypothetical protein